MKPSKMPNEDATLCSYTPMNAKKIDLTLFALFAL